MVKDCRLYIPPREPKKNIKHDLQMIWIRSQDQFNIEECLLSLQDQHKKRGLYVDNGCSKHMKGEKNRFLTMNKEQDGSFSFGNDNSTRIIGRGIVKLGRKDVEVDNFLLIEDMNQNLLSVIQMCDQGHNFVFD